MALPRADAARHPCVMDTATRNYPAGELRVSDADRDGALRELSEAFQVGRITADEFGQRSEQALGARTGKELTVLLADLPQDRASADTTATRRCHRKLVARIYAGASAAAATSLAALAVTNALSDPARAHYWAGTITPAAIAVLLLAVFIVLLRVARASRCEPRGAAR